MANDDRKYRLKTWRVPWLCNGDAILLNECSNSTTTFDLMIDRDSWKDINLFNGSCVSKTVPEYLGGQMPRRCCIIIPRRYRDLPAQLTRFCACAPPRRLVLNFSDNTISQTSTFDWIVGLTIRRWPFPPPICRVVARRCLLVCFQSVHLPARRRSAFGIDLCEMYSWVL